MPWCDECTCYFDHAASDPPHCPTCGAAAAPAPAAPWHFKLLVVGVVAYLALRAYQGAVWLVERL